MGWGGEARGGEEGERRRGDGRGGEGREGRGGEWRGGKAEIPLLTNFYEKTSLYSPWNKLMIITYHRSYSSVYDMSMTDAREVVEWIHGCELWHGQSNRNHCTAVTHTNTDSDFRGSTKVTHPTLTAESALCPYIPSLVPRLGCMMVKQRAWYLRPHGIERW